LVEAGGIEPPSEGFQPRASTCIAGVLDLAPLKSPRRGRRSASLSSVSPATAPRRDAAD